MRSIVRVFASFLILFFGIGTPVQADQSSVTVMSRNIYLGADVGIAMNLLPNFKAAAQFMWEQVQLTDFNQRSKALASEIAIANPDVIGIQEATKWMCQKSLISPRVTVYDFTQMLLVELNQLGKSYEIATNGDSQAINPGFSIPPIPHVTLVTDAQVFPDLFGADTVACGFEIADVLLIKSDLTKQVNAVGTTEFESAYSIIPTLMTVYRGFSWADITIDGSEIRFVTTHLESLWDEGDVPLAKIQADQLINDLTSSGIPVIIMGDFNSDPRDPRGSSKSNPGEQPVASDVCPEQVEEPGVSLFNAECNAYWTMIQAGYIDAGPDSADPLNATWGTDALLAGPDPRRLSDAMDFGNQFGFSDRLDYVFLSPELRAASSIVIGNTWPNVANPWNCESLEQQSLSQLALSILGLPNVKTGCLPSDHAGLVVQIDFEASKAVATGYPDSNKPFLIGLWEGIGIGLLLLIVWGVRKRVTTSRASKAV